MEAELEQPERIGARGIQSIEIGTRILRTFAEVRTPLTLSDIARRTGMPAARVHAYLTSYRVTGLVEQAQEGGPYALGPVALELGLARLYSAEPYEIAAVDLRGLADSMRAAVSLNVWGSHGPTVVLNRAASRDLWVNPLGAVLKLSTTAAGRVWSAFVQNAGIPDRLLNELFDLTSNRRLAKIAFDRILEELEAIRVRGYAALDADPWPGVSAVAAPIFDHGGDVRFTVACYAPSFAIDITPSSPQLAALLTFVRGVSAKLGWRDEARPRASSKEI